MPAGLQTVIVVDDDAAVRSALRFALEVEGFRVRAYDGAASVLDAGTLPADGCLVVDLRMRGMDGLQLVDELRERGLAIPAILMVSEIVTPSLRERARQSGVSEVLEKPLSDGALAESIRHAFKLSA